MAAARVTRKLRLADLRTVTRSRTAEPTQDGPEIYRRAAGLLERERVAEPVGRIGVSASTPGTAGTGQLPLPERDVPRRERLGRALDTLAGRSGKSAVRPAALLEHAPRRERRGVRHAAL